MFAGAAREAVFSNADVIRRISESFVPIALKAALVNNPPDNEEGLLYREIGRSKIVPQGICVVNPAGKVLNWVLMFDDDKSVLAFLDHSLKRFAKYPDAKKPVPAERHHRFPSRKLNDVADNSIALRVPERHAKGKHCPATPPLPEGAVEARLIGRALDKDGKPLADTLRQEHYVEDRFTLSAGSMRKLAETLADAGEKRVELPVSLARPFVAHAHLGVLDVAPISNPGRSKGELKKCAFWAQPVKGERGTITWRIEGESSAHVGAGMANGTPGDEHDVELMWHGFIEMRDKRVTRIVLSAEGSEKLKFGTGRPKIVNEVAVLPGGRRIDISSGVRYGIIVEAR